MRGLNGNEAAQPRVFAHDMVPVAIGAINPRQEGTGATLNGVANGLEMTSGGATQAVGDVLTLSAGSGTVAAQDNSQSFQGFSTSSLRTLSWISGAFDRDYIMHLVHGDLA